MYRYTFSIHFAFTFSYWFFLLTKAHILPWRRLYSSLDVIRMYPRSIYSHTKVLRRSVSWMMRPLDNVSLTDVSQSWAAYKSGVSTAATFINLGFAHIIRHIDLIKTAPNVPTRPIFSWKLQSHPHKGINRAGTLRPRDASSRGRFIQGRHRQGTERPRTLVREHIGRERIDKAP